MKTFLFFNLRFFQIFSSSHRLLGDRLFSLVFKPFVYNLFIAGESKKDILETMENMKRKQHLNPLLSPMLEDDPDQEETPCPRKRYNNEDAKFYTN